MKTKDVEEKGHSVQNTERQKDDWTSLFYTNLTLGWDGSENAAPEWMKAICPDVVTHFDLFPYYSKVPQTKDTKTGKVKRLPVSTTLY